MKPYVLACTFARGGSKGVPGKNVRPLAGKPLIAYAIEAARACPSVSRVIVSTDSESIAEVARRHGAEVPFLRPAELATDSSPELLAWQHAIRSIEADGTHVDVLASSPATTPLKKPEDIEACISLLLKSDADFVVTITPSHSNPYYNAVVVENGYIRLVANSAAPVHRRQDAPAVYDIAGVAYAARASYVMSTDSLMAGKVRAVEVPRERAVDIDTEFDFCLAEFLLGRAAGAAR